MNILLILLAFAAGTLMPVQAGINALLRKVLGDPLQASFISFFVGTLALGLWSLAARHTWPSFAELTDTPAWLWTGGLLGAAFVTVTIFLGPKLGASTMTAFLLLGQLVASAVLDHFGLIGFPEHPVTLWRIAGICLLGLGAWMIRAF